MGGSFPTIPVKTSRINSKITRYITIHSNLKLQNIFIYLQNMLQTKQ